MLQNSLFCLTGIVQKAIFAEKIWEEGSSMQLMLEFFFVYGTIKTK